jgi:hypothetical protein
VTPLDTEVGLRAHQRLDGECEDDRQRHHGGVRDDQAIPQGRRRDSPTDLHWF